MLHFYVSGNKNPKGETGCTFFLQWRDLRVWLACFSHSVPVSVWKLTRSSESPLQQQQQRWLSSPATDGCSCSACISSGRWTSCVTSPSWWKTWSSGLTATFWQPSAIISLSRRKRAKSSRLWTRRRSAATPWRSFWSLFTPGRWTWAGRRRDLTWKQNSKKQNKIRQNSSQITTIAQ